MADGKGSQTTSIHWMSIYHKFEEAISHSRARLPAPKLCLLRAEDPLSQHHFERPLAIYIDHIRNEVIKCCDITNTVTIDELLVAHPQRHFEKQRRRKNRKAHMLTTPSSKTNILNCSTPAVRGVYVYPAASTQHSTLGILQCRSASNSKMQNETHPFRNSSLCFSSLQLQPTPFYSSPPVLLPVILLLSLRLASVAARLLLSFCCCDAALSFPESGLVTPRTML